MSRDAKEAAGTADDRECGAARAISRIRRTLKVAEIHLERGSLGETQG
jgi:hypothetical protein